ncbi:hypothetical protein ABT297_07940 [Dactylosporangium sp. NPDC000555]|uniref:hypothetical protein n=1 Tax=Dactylosporangium sp. NPDC000555 TaxID=3154260 RepID=UPI00331AFD0C
MSFAVPASAPRARPSTVSLAAMLLFAAAAIEVINVVLSLLYAQKIAEATKRVYEQAGAPTNSTGAAIGATVNVVFGFVIVVILVLLGYFISRGSQVARILTWVLGGIAFCCNLFGLGSLLFAQPLWDQARKATPKLPTWDEYQRIVSAEVPGWYQPVTTVLSILLILAILVPIILLALPASHPYFRKPQQEWEPPVPGGPGGFPGQPGQPGDPGQPGPPTA